VSFHLLQAKCGSRIRHQNYCPACDQVVDRSDLVKAYEVGKDRYIRVTEDELQALEGEASKAEQVAIARFILRGKESLVLIRPFQRGLILHTMYFHDEILDVGEIDRGEAGKIKESELQLALRLIEELASEEFDPKKYDDEYRRRALALVKEKAEGKEGTTRASAGATREGDRSDGRSQEELGEARRSGGGEERERGT
jgi:DNA end-binding protein Ku